MKNRKYLQRLSIIMLMGLIAPTLLVFLIFWRSAFGRLEQSNENFYEKALRTYTSLLDRKIRELEMSAAEISAGSREHDSALLAGGRAVTEDAYKLYMAVNELKEKYSRSDVSEWGIYFYDTDKIITSECAYLLEHFLYKYMKTEGEVGCPQFFSEDNYVIRETFFDTIGSESDTDGYLLAGICTRIGEKNDRALIFYVLSPKDISDSLAIVGGEGITYFLLDRKRDEVLLVWGDALEESAESILKKDEWSHTSHIKQRVLYNIGSNYPQLSVTAYISQDSMQNSLLDWAMRLRWGLFCTVLVLLLICILAVYVSYKPVYELVSEFGDADGGEFERIRNTLNGKDLRISEQEMLILDLLMNHLIYGVPISRGRIQMLGIGEDVHYYCVFLVEGYFFVNSKAEQLARETEREYGARIFITDWQEENYSVVIAFLKEEEVAGVQKKLVMHLKESYEENSLYTGKVVDRPEDIQLSFRSCLSQRKKKNGRKEKVKPAGEAAGTKEEQQQRMKEEILSYLEIHYRDADLSQVQVADMFRISNYTLSRLFKNQVGVGFAEYLTAKRLEYAKVLLLTTSHSVKEVAMMAGFASENYFSRTFKIYEGVPPSGFRKQ